MRHKSILLITTADTDILTAERALPVMPDGAPPVVAVNQTSLPPGDGGEIMALASDAGAVALRLLGGKRAMPAAFDALARHCRNSGIPLIACPGHQEWDEDLVAACTVAVAEVETVFAYLMPGGVPNFQNLFLFLSDTYFGTDYGHEAPAPLPWEGIYHPDLPDGMDVDAYIAAGWSADYLDNLNVPVIQAIAGAGPQRQWLESDLGLGPIDTAMSVALPEFDGRLISVPVSFKEESEAGGDELVRRIIDRCSNDRDSLTEQQLRLAAGHVDSRRYAQWFSAFPDDVAAEMSRHWGPPPGEVYRINGRLAIAGLDLGHVFVGLQPPRGFGENPSPSITAPTCPPRTTISPITAGFGMFSAPTPSFTWASTAHWNGCRAKASGFPPPATPKWPWTMCRCSTRSSSTTPARVPKPSAAPTPPSSTT